MKKLIAISAVLLASVVQAEFMQWAVNDYDIPDEIVSEVKYMRVGYVTADNLAPCWKGSALEAFDQNGDTTGGADVGFVDGADFQVDLTGLTVDTYSFYIELLNSQHQVIGRSTNLPGKDTNYATYADLYAAGYISTGDIGSTPTAEIFYGGDGFTACPEPSSMALLALGAGLVGLRRKLKKGKKGKRA